MFSDMNARLSCEAIGVRKRPMPMPAIRYSRDYTALFALKRK
jgi:hypothetical protein